MKGIDFDIQTDMYTTGKEPKDTMWFRNIDNFINEINRFALLGTVTNKNGWLINNGIYYAGWASFIARPQKDNKLLQMQCEFIHI